MLNANGKEDLEGIPEEEEEIMREETLEPAKDDSDSGNDVYTNTNSLLIQETVQDQEDDRQQSKAPFFKVLANFSFLKKKSPKDPTASQEQDPLDDSTNIIDKNGLPSYDEVIDQQAEKTDKVTTECKETLPEAEHDSNENIEEHEEHKSKDDIPSEKSSKCEIETNGLAEEEDGIVPNDEVEEIEDHNTSQELDETRTEEKKFRFRFQFFSDKK